MSVTQSELLVAAQNACIYLVRTRKVPNGPPVEDYEEAFVKLSKAMQECPNIRPAVWAVVLGGLSDILKDRYGKKDW